VLNCSNLQLDQFFFVFSTKGRTFEIRNKNVKQNFLYTTKGASACVTNNFNITYELFPAMDGLTICLSFESQKQLDVRCLDSSI
jgi:hypothetical protein